MKKKHVKTTEQLQCKYCDNMVTKTYESTVAVTCWRCSMQLADGKTLEVRK